MIARAVGCIIVAALALAACSGDDDAGPADGSPRADVTLAAITRLPGGTPVPLDTRTLQSLTCNVDTLTLQTDREALTAPMTCDRMLPESITSRFIGKTVAIRYERERLIIESATEGSMELPSGSPVLSEGR